MKPTAALYHLQTLDSAADSARSRLAEIERLLGENAELRAAQEAVSAAEASLQQWKTRHTDLDLERQRLKQEADAAEQRLYSGQVHNPRELTDLQHKLAELRRRHADLEEPQIEALLEIEQGTAALQQAQQTLQRVAARQAGTVEALLAEQSSLRARLDDLIAQIGQARTGVPPASLRQYDQLRKRPGGVAVAAITVGSECSSCGVEITSSLQQQVRRGEVLTCPTCGRLLYAS